MTGRHHRRPAGAGRLGRVARTAPAGVLALVLGPVLALLLTGCGPGTGDTDPGTATGAGSGGADGQSTLTVLAAASLTDVFERIAADFEAGHAGVEVELSFAASSTIVQQVNQGAPADVVALAGEEPLEALDLPAPGVGAAPEPVVFTTNALAVAVPADDPAGVTSVEDVAADGIRLVVCAEEVPCGAAASTLFDRVGIDPQIASFEPDVRAVLTKVALGEADAGIVYRTDVAAAGDVVRGIRISPAHNVVTRYPVLAVSGSDLSREFVDEVLSARGQQHLTDLGFVAP